MDKRNNVDCQFHTGNKQRFPVWQPCVLSTHPSTPASSDFVSLHTTSSDFLVCSCHNYYGHLTIKLTMGCAHMTYGVVFTGGQSRFLYLHGLQPATYCHTVCGQHFSFSWPCLYLRCKQMQMNCSNILRPFGLGQRVRTGMVGWSNKRRERKMFV